MTREEELDWLCRLRSEIYVYMPKEWLIPMNNALDIAISALKGEWNPLKSDEEGMIIGSLPEEGEEVLVTVYGQVEIDSFGCDVEYDESVGECRNEWFCENNDIEDVRAWMPKPKPYKAESEENEINN